MTVDGIKCSACGTELDSRSMDLPRTPCPNCSATARTISATSVATLHIGGSATATVTSAPRQLDLPGLLMQALIVPDSRTAEGQLVRAVAIPWFDIIEAIGRDPALVFEISPRKWEEIIAGAYTKAGFDEVVLTPQSGDFGRDIIAIKRGIGSVRIIDQVKAYRPGHLVTADDVRALLGVLHGDKASKGFLTTTSDFAPRLRDDILIKEFMPSRLELIDGQSLVQRLRDIAREP